MLALALDLRLHLHLHLHRDARFSIGQGKWDVPRRAAAAAATDSVIATWQRSDWSDVLVRIASRSCRGSLVVVVATVLLMVSAESMVVFAELGLVLLIILFLRL